MKDYRGKNVLVTGASSGIGEAIALRYAVLGARLHLAARRADRLEDVCRRCLESGAEYAGAYTVDFSSEQSVREFAAEISRQEILFDVIVLNAGISQRSLALETGLEVDRKIMETDFFGPVCLTVCLADQLRGDRRVSIAVTTSISGLFGFPLRSGYCAAKHALHGWFESLQLENPNLRVTFLVPGRINTQISRSAVLGDGSSYSKMDPGQDKGMDVDRCAAKAVHAIDRGRRMQLIGGVELLMVYIKKYCPALFFKLAGKVSAT